MGGQFGSWSPITGGEDRAVKVRMKVTLSGTLDGVAYPRAGVSWEVPDPVGANLCAKGYAEPVVEDTTEKAVVTEQAEVRRGRPRNPA